MIIGFALRNLFFGEQVYVLGIPKPLAPPPALGAEDYPVGLHQIKLKKQV